MGRYRRGHKHRKGRHRKHYHGDGGQQLTDPEWILLEKYLLEYRSKAYEVHRSKGKLCVDANLETTRADAVIIGGHDFLPLTTENCKRPFIDLPDTLGGRERRKIHSICSHLDLYHTGAGVDDKSGQSSVNHVRKRRIVVSIYADGFGFVPDLDPSSNAKGEQSFPSHTCKPWYYHAYDKSTGDNQNYNYARRKETIVCEKKQIHEFVSLPEKSLRIDDATDSLDFNILNSLDLSMVPTPDDTPWMLVDSVEKLKQCVSELSYGADECGDDNNFLPRTPKIRELAFDLEMDNVLDNSNGNTRFENITGIRTCLIQLTSDVTTSANGTSDKPMAIYKDFVIDPLAPGVWDAIATELGPLFSNPNIVKIGHAIGGMDVSSLHRDFGILVVNAFDTFEASACLGTGRDGMGLAALCRHYGLPNWEHYMELKDKYQASNWKKRPLETDALEYGRYDIRYLVTLRKLLMRDLVKRDLLGGGLRSNVDSDSGFESNKEGTSAMKSFDSQPSSMISSNVSSFSENEFAQMTSISSLDQPSNIGEEVVETMRFRKDANFESNESQGATQPIIHTSDFPCYHYLMKAISVSQKRCLKLWTERDEEPVLRHPALISIIKQAAKQEGYGKEWNDTNTELYKSMCDWRQGCAQKEKIHTSEVCSLDFLVYVALKMPKTLWEMRRYSYDLPKLLQDDSLPYCNELLEIVAAYRKPSCDSQYADAVFYSHEYEIADETNVVGGRHNHLFRVLVVSAVVGAISLTLLTRRR